MTTPPPVPGMVLFIRFFCALAFAAVGACVMVAWTPQERSKFVNNALVLAPHWPLNAAIGLAGGFFLGLVGAKIIEAGLPDDK